MRPILLHIPVCQGHKLIKDVTSTVHKNWCGTLEDYIQIKVGILSSWNFLVYIFTLKKEQILMKLSCKTENLGQHLCIFLK